MDIKLWDKFNNLIDDADTYIITYQNLLKIYTFYCKLNFIVNNNNNVGNLSKNENYINLENKLCEELELFDFEFKMFLFFRCICYFHNICKKRVHAIQSILDIIKKYYPRVTFYYSDTNLYFKIKSVKRSHRD